MTADAARRAGALLLTLAALGEMAVGVLVAAFPAVAPVLLGAPLEGNGLVVARMMGLAILVIGLTWWLSRSESDRIARHAPGFLLYNIGIGLLFAVTATSAPLPLIPWLVAIAHLGTGAVFATLAAMARSSAAAPPG